MPDARPHEQLHRAIAVLKKHGHPLPLLRRDKDDKILLAFTEELFMALVDQISTLNAALATAQANVAAALAADGQDNPALAPIVSAAQALASATAALPGVTPPASTVVGGTGTDTIPAI